MADDDAPQLVVHGYQDQPRSHVDGRAVVTGVGDLDASTVSAFESALRAAVADLTVDLIAVDASGITFIDSMGIRSLLVARSAAEDRGARLVVDPAAPVVRRVLRLAGLASLLAPPS